MTVNGLDVIREYRLLVGLDAEHAALARPEAKSGEMIDAARCYLIAAHYAEGTGRAMEKWMREGAAFWPWDEELWHPSADPIECLTRAGALISAEIERLKEDPE